MAAYACTVTPAFPRAMKYLQFFGLGVFIGKADITNYNQTGAEVTGITKFFNGGAPTVVCSGVSDGAVKQLVRWDPTEKCFHCYVPTTGAETANDVDVGEVNFIAIGRA
jgi:hypothetical protein